MDEDVKVILTVRFEGPDYALDYLKEAMEQIPEGNAFIIAEEDADEDEQED